MATTKIKATCACHAFNLEVEYLNSSLPIERALCLCNSCKQVSGSCGVTTLPVPSTQTIDLSKFSLTAYSTSKSLTRYFCSICGAHTLQHSTEDNSWNVSSGLWDRTEGIVNWTGCEWVKDTLDGGISIWLKETKDVDGNKMSMKRWLIEDFKGELVPENESRSLPAKLDKNPSEKLKAQCHCGGVKFYITRPNEASEKIRSPFPDLMIPYFTNSSANPDNRAWWVPVNGKYLAGTCTCISCRLASGFEVQPWAFVPKCNILQEDGKALDFQMGTLKTYPSSEGVWREFCGVCGANVFWRCKENRPDLVDVSVGLLDPEEGARAENWLWWWKNRVSFREFCVSERLVASLEAGLAATLDDLG